MIQDISKRVFQTIYTDQSKGVIGNCLAACLASYLDFNFEDVPHYTSMRDYRDYLQKHGYEVVLCEGHPPKDGNCYITSYEVCNKIARSLNIRHAVICKNGKIIHDPREVAVKLIGPKHYYRIRKCV